MRIIIASRIFAPEPAAAAFRLKSLMRALAEAGAAVTVLTVRASSRQVIGAIPGVRVFRWPVLRDRSGAVRGYAQYMSFDIPLFLRLLVAHRPDVVVAEPPPTTGLVAAVVCRLRRIPLVYYAADIWSDASESTGAPTAVVRLLRRIERSVLHRSAQVIAVSDGVAARVTEICPTASVRVVANGVDTEVFKPEGETRQLGPCAVYAGTTSEWQGADIFIRAMPTVLRQIPDARLVFVGQGSAWDALKRQAVELGLTSHVEFHDAVPPEQAAMWLRSARVSLVSIKPGQGYDFAIPTKIYASAACGTPVVYAGPDPASDLISASGLGRAERYSDNTVAEAVTRGLATVPTSMQRQRLALWAEQHRSLKESGSRAAAVVLDLCKAVAHGSDRAGAL